MNSFTNKEILYYLVYKVFGLLSVPLISISNWAVNKLNKSYYSLDNKTALPDGSA